MSYNNIITLALILLIFILLGRIAKAIEACKMRKALEEYDRRLRLREQKKLQRQQECQKHNQSNG